MTVRASEFPPPFAAGDYVSEPTDPADERIEVGVLIVGAGPAGLACAIRLGQLLEEHPDVAERLGDVPVALVEKGKQPGSHLRAGAGVNPRSLRRLFKDRYRIEDMPSYGRVDGEFFARAARVRRRERGTPAVRCELRRVPRSDRRRRRRRSLAQERTFAQERRAGDRLDRRSAAADAQTLSGAAHRYRRGEPRRVTNPRAGDGGWRTHELDAEPADLDDD